MYTNTKDLILSLLNKKDYSGLDSFGHPVIQNIHLLILPVEKSGIIFLNLNLNFSLNVYGAKQQAGFKNSTMLSFMFMPPIGAWEVKLEILTD